MQRIRAFESGLNPYSTGYYLYCIKQVTGEGNGIALQYSCLENPMDGGAW